MTQFTNNVNGPNYGQLNQAGRDLEVVNDDALHALHSVGRLRSALDLAPLTSTDKRLVERELDLVDRELRSPRPDRSDVAQRMSRVAEILKSAGALASAGAALLGPLGAIAGFLGPVGAAIVKSAR
jgi:hypothetical protein